MADTNTRDFMIGVLVGGAIGAAVALLYAPQSGVETRQLVRDKASEAGGKASELAGQARTKVSDLTHQAQARVGEMGSQARGKVGEIGGQVQSAIDRAKETVQHQKEALRTAVDAGRSAYQEKQSELHTEVSQDVLPADTTPMAPPPTTRMDENPAV
ncbi:MAG: YtxH domain-containing protein [Armatimonadota bacterium]